MKAGWAARAAAVAEQLPLGRLHPAALAAAPAGVWAVALSGGGDSVALLLLLWAHYPRRRRKLVALHFDHGLRGPASRADARFCRRLCAELGVRYEEGRWTERAGKDPAEAQSRDARNRFLEGACRRRRAAALWLGHQQDDIAETLLMRVARGSGTAGLAAPRPVSAAEAGATRRLRPLLTLPKAEIERVLRQAGAAFRTDQSNRGGRFLRNRVRHRVISAWKKAADGDRDPVAGAALTRSLMEEDDQALEAWTEGCRALTPAGRLNLKRLSGMPRAVWRRALQRWVVRQRQPAQDSPGGNFKLSRAGFERLLEAILTGKTQRISLGAADFARIRRGWLYREGG
ncbi:MAG TPA: tRNA lysidine(34) synthetase TilS [Opitutaceae bacterium]|nr:tRNA lysidine(34) synthetase TilS [Opitutaceae bacterium]